METKQERRKFTRYPIKNGAYATISPESTKLGQIVDISVGGLAFKYIDTEPDTLKTAGSQSQETLFLSSMGYYVGDIDFKTVSDYEIPDCNIPEASFDTMKIRVRHVKFTDLKLKQLFDLDYYIENNTTETQNFTSIQ
ncbi:MAG: PilZ domain-containing protein [Desulfobacteraceae bacterium]|nr:PilZ domain-containing protein [Desulfobacteraceae bacterium]